MHPEAFPNIEGYRILDIIGEGGMAQVFLAQQASVDRKVALKVLPTQLVEDDSFEKRFFREAQNAAKLSHQSIVPIYDYGISNGFHYIAMEFLPGGDLKKRMLEGLRITDAISIIKTIARALDYAAKKGLVHRDIKPENILFREDGSPVLSDFGIARQINSHTDITLLGSLVGTPRYMSPEQAQDYEVDHRSDLYSLGVILYELLTGTAPFISDSAISVSIKHITELPPPLPPQLSVFQGIIDKVLAKHPEERFQSGDDLASALAQTEDRLASTYAQTVIRNDSDAINATEITRRRGMRYSPQSTPRPAPRPDFNAALLPDVAPKPFYRRPTTLAIAALLVLQAIAFVGWYWSTTKPEAEFNPGQYHPDNIIPGMAEKAEELLSKARQAAQAQHLFEPHNDNAQYYLTTLLALVPHHATARAEISQLFGLYLNQAEALIASGNTEEAETFLNQSSQISYYIEDTDTKERFTQLYQSLLQKRQQQMIEAERSKKVEALLAQAEQALAADRLTSPPGDNAFDYFQQILLEAPQHEQALAGIQRTALALLENARKQAAAGLFPLAHALIAAAAQIDPDQPLISETQAAIIAAEQNANSTATTSPDTTALPDTTTAPDTPANVQTATPGVLDPAVREQINGWLITAQRLMEEGQLIKPEHDNALAFYDKVLAQDYLNIDAIQGREKIGARLVEQASGLAEAGKYAEARSLLANASKLLTNKSSLFTARQNIAELEKLNTINQLLIKAEAAVQADRLEYPENDNAAAHYKQVLTLDATNIRARQGIETVGLKYVELSRNALSKNRYSLARKLLEKARRYTTSEIEIRMAESFLAEAATPEKIQELLIQARAAEAQNRLTKPAYTNAMYLFQQVVALDPAHQEALEALNRIGNQYAGQVASAMNERQFARARELLEVLKELGDTERYNHLREQVIVAEKAEAMRTAEEKARKERERLQQIEQNRQMVERYLTEIRALQQAGVDARNSMEIIERYQAILAIAPQHQAARIGLDQAIEREAELARKALQELRLADADMHLERIRVIRPDSDLSSLNNLKAQALQTQQQVEALTAKIESMLATPYRKPGWFESHKEQRNALTATYNLIAQLRTLVPTDTRIPNFLARLDHKYASIVTTLMQTGDGEARDFINDTGNYDWQSPELDAVIQAAR